MHENQEKKSLSQNQSSQNKEKKCRKCANVFIGSFCSRCGGIATVNAEETLKTMPQDSDMFKGAF